MKKHFTKTTWILLILCIISFIGHIFVYPMLPDVIPIQWSTGGEVSNWGQKYMDLVLAALPIIILFLMVFLPEIDPRKENYKKHIHVSLLFTIGVTLLLIACSWLSVLAALGYNVNIHTLLPVAIGIMFIAFGNRIPQVRSNYFFGIKTPWTLANEDVWRKTHKMGGILFCIMGILFVIGALIDNSHFIEFVLVPFLLGSIIFLYVYSYLDIKKIVLGK